MKPPKDLTMIAEENGGTFPFWRVFDIIAGDTKVEGHDTSQMPLFSERMRGQESAGVFPPAPLRVLALTHYLDIEQRHPPLALSASLLPGAGALAPSALRLLVLTPRRQRIIDDTGRNSVILPQLYSYDRRP